MPLRQAPDNVPFTGGPLQSIPKGQGLAGRDDLDLRNLLQGASKGDDNSAPINYTINADGTVEPISGGSSGGGGFPPDSGGGDIPPLPPDLADYMVVHHNLLILTDPNSGITTYTANYIPPANTKYLGAVAVAFGRTGGSSATNDPILTLNGAPGSSTNWANQNTSGANNDLMATIVSSWTAPAAGVIELDLSAPWNAGAQTYAFVLPISIIGQSPNAPSTTSLTSVTPGNGATESIPFTTTLPSAFAFVRTRLSATARPGQPNRPSSSWTDFKLFNYMIDSPVYSGGVSPGPYVNKLAEVQVGFRNPGANSAGWIWPDSFSGVANYWLRQWVL